VAALAAVFIGALDLTVIATVLPRIIFDLGVNTADVDRYIWVVNGYLLAYLIAIPIMGRVSDLIGRRPAFLLALGVFLAGSLLCAFAERLPELIAGRVIQGAGGGALLPVTMALVGDLLPPARRVSALGLVGAVDTLGWVLGPLWGAAIVGAFGGRDEPWRLVFAINLPLGVAAAAGIVMTHRGVRRSAGAGWLRRLDLPGALLLAVALLLLNLGLSAGGELGGATGSGVRAFGGTPNPLADYLLPLVAAAVAIGAVFVWWERRAESPLLPMGLFRERRFVAAIAANFLVGAALIVAMVDVPVTVALLVDQERISTVSALMLAPFTLLMAALSFAGGVIAGRRGERTTAAGGLLLVGIGYGLLWGVFHGQEYHGMLPGLIVAGAGFGLVIAPIGASAINAAPAADRGVAAGLTMAFRLLGMAIGISTLTAFGVRRLQSLTGLLDPIVQGRDETTAEFLVRQQQFIEDHLIPLSTRVIRETFLIAAALALLALIPIFFLPLRHTLRAPGLPRSQTGIPSEVEE
jgi:EmrB/QacA subfamily drug resistance transporter